MTILIFQVTQKSNRRHDKESITADFSATNIGIGSTGTEGVVDMAQAQAAPKPAEESVSANKLEQGKGVGSLLACGHLPSGLFFQICKPATGGNPFVAGSVINLRPTCFQLPW